MDYKEFTTNLAHQAGKIMRANFQGGMQKEWKSDNTPLTASDTAINVLVVAAVNATFPEHAVLGEEGGNQKVSDYVWVLDPIDGTIPFSHGMPLFVFSLALTHKGESILGVIYDPTLDRMVYAEKGKGTFMNDEPVRVCANETVSRTLIEVQSWKGYAHNLNPLKDQLIEQGAQVTTICSVIYAALLLACGEYSAILFSGTKPWDAASVKIIVEEAGGTVTDLQGNEQRYDQPTNGIIASNGALHDQLVRLVQQL